MKGFHDFHAFDDDFDKQVNRTIKLAQIGVVIGWLTACIVLSGLAYVAYRLLIHFGVM